MTDLTKLMERLRGAAESEPFVTDRVGKLLHEAAAALEHSAPTRGRALHSSRSEMLEEAAKDCEAHAEIYRAPAEYETGTLRARREAMAMALHRQAVRLRALGSAAQEEPDFVDCPIHGKMEGTICPRC